MVVHRFGRRTKQFSQVGHGPASFVAPGAILLSNNYHPNTTRVVATIITVFEKSFILPGSSMKKRNCSQQKPNCCIDANSEQPSYYGKHLLLFSKSIRASS